MYPLAGHDIHPVYQIWKSNRTLMQDKTLFYIASGVNCVIGRFSTYTDIARNIAPTTMRHPQWTKVSLLLDSPMTQLTPETVQNSVVTSCLSLEVEFKQGKHLIEKSITKHLKKGLCIFALQ